MAEEEGLARAVGLGGCGASAFNCVLRQRLFRLFLKGRAREPMLIGVEALASREHLIEPEAYAVLT